MITFTPLAGSARASQTTPCSYLLQVDDVRILVDCGSPDWCPEPDPSSSTSQSTPRWEAYCDALKECARTVDLVLISHGDLPHAGLYPFAWSHWGLRAPAYTTLPVQAMARISTLEDVDDIRAQEPVDEHSTSSVEMESKTAFDELYDMPETAEEVETKEIAPKSGKYIATSREVQEAFDSVNTLRFSQPTHLQGKCQGLTITAFNAGHSLGGTIWKIRSPSAGTILYAVDLNHTRERHLDGTVLVRGAGGSNSVFETLARPDLFITDAERTLTISCRRKDRDAQLLDTVTSTLQSRHSIFMPCDSCTRLLEALVLLDQHWKFARLRYPICLISKTAQEMLAFVRSMMEWLGGTINREDVGEEGRNKSNRRKVADNDDEALGALALQFKSLEIFPTPQALLQTYSSKDPKVILAVPSTLSHGPSREIFSEFALVQDNVILLTSRSESGTLGRALFDMWDGQQREDDKWAKGKLGRNIMMEGSIDVTIKSKVPLQGPELEEYLEKERLEKEKEAAHQAALARSQRMLEADEDETDSDSDGSDADEVEDVLMNTGMDTGEDAAMNPDTGRLKRKRGDIGDWGMEADDGGIKQLLSYDIYLKGHVSKAASFFKTNAGQTERYRMFPYIERKRRIDEYGEVIDVGTWLRKGRVFEEEAETDEVKEAKRKQQAEEEALKAAAEPPSKFISHNFSVQLACRLLFVDMEGVNDGRAVKSIVHQVNPRKMIIVKASQEATDNLLEACSNIRSMTKDIYSPAIGETVQIGHQTNTFTISLGEKLLANVKMSSFEDNEVGFVVGCISSYAGSTIPVLEPLSAASVPVSQEPGEPMLRPKVLGSRPTARLPRSTMIGDLKLTALKARLAKVGVKAEFAGGGVLICGGSLSAASEENADPVVSVKKTGEGKVEVEGTVSDVYYTVRREIYNLHAVVAA